MEKKTEIAVSYKKLASNKIGFDIEAYNPAYELIIDPSWDWNTFCGGTGADYIYDITTDASGNIILVGEAGASWGSPVNTFTGSSSEILVAKLNSSGAVQWHTFLGSSSIDVARSVNVDGSGNIYVAGYSRATWGTPENVYAGSADIIVVKLNNSGVLLWHTFLGSSDLDVGNGIQVDASGNIYVTGYSSATWGVPENAYTGGNDVVVAKLNNNGALLWHTFLGSSRDDESNGIDLDVSDNIYVIGRSKDTWGSPLTSKAGTNTSSDILLIKLSNSGALTWHDFIGSSYTDYGKDIVIDVSNNIYITGASRYNWGTPIVSKDNNDTHSDAFLAKVSSTDGGITWNTFMGSTASDDGRAVHTDGGSNIYVVGWSYSTWGSPENAHAGGGEDAFIARFNSSGTRMMNTFMGASSVDDIANSVAVSPLGPVYVAGESYGTWSAPITAHAGSMDGFVADLHSDVLPVELMSFGAMQVDDGILLKWQTATEVNNYGFEIERSLVISNEERNLEWEKIGFVTGHGNSNSPKSYSYLDQDYDKDQELRLKYRLKQIDTDGSFTYYSTIAEVDYSITGVENSSTDGPTEYSLSQNYPNPFNPSTTISYGIPVVDVPSLPGGLSRYAGQTGVVEGPHVSIKVYDILGNEVATLVDQHHYAGTYKVTFNAAVLNSGVYFYKLTAGSFSQLKKMLLLK
jgi:hypothetical protein